MTLLFKAKKKQVGDIYSFIFYATQPLAWVAGQSIRLELDTLYGTEERRFTISSAPYEKDIVITTELSGSDFKQALSKLKPGDEIKAFAVEGDFVWQNKSAIFIARGVGITPYISMLKQLAHEKSEPKDITLLYSAKSGKVAFEAQLKSLQKQTDKLSVDFMYDYRVNANVIKEKVPNFKERKIYISGPQKMVDEVSKELIQDLGYSEKSLKRDWFTGLK